MMEVLFSISLALVAGLLASRVVKPLKLPAVTGYLIAGILIGPYCLGHLNLPEGFDVIGMLHTTEGVEQLGIISKVALGFIAFAIGTEFEIKNLKKIGKQATVVGILQAVVTMIVVDAALIGLHFLLGEDRFPLSVAIILGAIATATAPAATLMVVKQYKAKGPLTNILLPVVALDDAVGLVAFAVSFGVARALQSGKVDLVSMLVEPLVEVVGSLILGALLGALFTWVESFFQSNSKRLCLSLTFVLMSVSLSMLKFEIGEVHVGFSSLLVCMMLGTVFCNICKHADELMEKTDKWTMPIYILFFVLSGAELELSVLTSGIVVLIGVVYILFRSLGKYVGAYSSAKMTGCNDNIVKYLGITLLPQAGVALGMSITVKEIMGAAEGSLVRNIILFSVLIYELVGPLLTKIALTRAGDIVSKEEYHKRLSVAEAFADEPDEEDAPVPAEQSAAK
ncbi:MAG: cation:proton antiporter [Clostridia bacterium]|nr:cation:proton antiporter [Clostridia bacterium]